MGKGSGRRVEDLTKVHEGFSRVFGESKLEKRLREEREALEALAEEAECCDEIDEEDDEYDYICPQCSGSGEGMWDGSSCTKCGGTGGWPKNREVDYD